MPNFCLINAENSKISAGTWFRQTDWRNVVKENMKRLIAGGFRSLFKNFGGLRAGLVAGICLTAGTVLAQPVNDLFANAQLIAGTTGTVTGTNTAAGIEICEPGTVTTDDNGVQAVDNSVWYSWTCTVGGTYEFDTIGSAFDTILAVYTTPTGLCDTGLTNIISDDNNGFNIFSDAAQTSYLKFQAVAGTTYYISVNGNATSVGNDNGALYLNWSPVQLEVTPAGTFQFTANYYPVSASESTIALDPSVSPSLQGARLTVTRTAGSVGRVFVGYQLLAAQYTNRLQTNYFGTNVSTTLIDSNGIGQTVNQTLNYIAYTNNYQYYDNGFKNYPVTGTLTNITSYTITGANTNLYVTNTLPLVSGPLVPVPTTFANGGVSFTNEVTNSPIFFIYQTNYFSFTATNAISGTNVSDGSVITNNGVLYTNLADIYVGTQITNFYGYNSSITISEPLIGAYVSTNWYFTNIVVTSSYYTNGLYTNGSVEINQFSSLLTNSATTNLAVISVSDVGTNSPTSSIPLPYGGYPSNIPPVGNFLIGTPVVLVDTNNNTLITFTNSYSKPTIVVLATVSAAPLFGTNNYGTLAFDDYQMSLDIPTVPVSAYSPSTPDGSSLPSLINATLTGVTNDPLESADLQPATISPTGGGSLLNILNDNFASGQVTNDTGAIYFNFQHRFFRVYETTANAVIGVNRTGAGKSCSVDYRIDYRPPTDALNNFTLCAGSDYATPNVDYTSVTGTLAWGDGDYTTKYFSVPIFQDGIVEFDEDMLLQLFNPQPNPGPPPSYVGDVGVANLTILFNDQPAGAVDRNWNTDNSPNSNPPHQKYPGTAGNGGTVYALASQVLDGTTFVAGSFNSYDSTPYNRLVRVLNDGFQDPSFMAPPNSGANDFIASLALYPVTSTNFGKLLIAGNFTSFNGTNRFRIARLNYDGSLDTSFTPGLGANGMVWSIALLPNDQVVMGGQFTSYNGTNINEVARLNQDGSLDTTFNSGSGPDSVVNSLALDSAGRVIIGGAFSTVNGVTSGGVARLNVDGSVDTTFNPGIGTYNPDTSGTDPVYAVAVQSNGQILVGGSFANMELTEYNGLARLNTDGSVDPTFHPGTGTLNPLTGDVDTVYAITLQPDGGILIGGNFTTFNQTRRVGLARLYSIDGTVDTTFMDTAYNQFAGIPNHYHNPDAVNPALYPTVNQRNTVYAISVEPYTTNVFIGGSFLRVGGGSTRDDIHNRGNVARLIGGVTPGPGNIELSYSSYTANKSSGNLYVSLVRTNGNLGEVYVTFGTNTAAPGVGIARGSDMTLTTRTPTWSTAWSASSYAIWMKDDCTYGPNYATVPPGVTTADVNVGIINNTNVTGNLSANFTLTNPASQFVLLGGENIPLGTALGYQTASPFTIIDDSIHAGTLAFSSTNYSVVQSNNAVATITVTRTGGSDGVVHVNYSAGNGTPPNAATNGLDFTAVTGTLTFGQSVLSQTFTVPILNRTTVQPDRNVKLRLYTTSGGAGLAQSNAVLTIINGNYTPGHISFSSSVYTTNENNRAALITVNRLGGSSGYLNVNMYTVDGTAVNGVNYVGTNVLLSWNNGDATPRTIAIPVIDDGLVTSNLTVNLRLSNATIGGVANTNLLGLSQYTNSTLIINNVDNAGKVEFSSPVYSVKKYGGYALIPIVRTGGSAQSLTVSYYTVDGTALAGVNYSAVTNTVTFTNGQVAAFFNVPVIDDGVSAGLKSLTLALAGATNTLGVPSTATLNIIDSESVNETPGSADTTYSSLAGFNDNVYTLTLVGTNQLLVGGDFTMADGVARNRVARLNPDGTLDSSFSFPSTSYGANGSVRAMAVQSDGHILVGGLFTSFNSVALSRLARLNPDGTLDSLFNPGSGADSAVYALAETFVGGASKALVAGAFANLNGQNYNGIGRLNYDGTPDTNFNSGGLGANGAVYALAVYPTNSPNAGKIVIGGDFTAYNGATNFNHIARLNVDGSVDNTFNVAGSGANDSVRAIALQLDGQIIIGGLFTNVNGAILPHVARLNADGTVDTSFSPGVGANDAVFSIGVQTDNRIVLGGEFTLASGVTRNRITRLNPDGSVDPTINFGYGANSFVSAIAIQEDIITGYPTNVPDEKIIIGGGFTTYNGDNHQHLARIYGGSIGGSGAFQFTQANYSVHETGTNIVVTVVRTGGTSGTNFDGTGDVYVPFATSNITAVAGINYAGLVTNLDFPEGEIQQNVTIPVYDDGVVTPDLQLSLNLSDPATDPNPPSEIGLQPIAWLTIINDDSAVAFASPNYSVAKNIVSGVAQVNIIRLGGTNSTSTVSFTTLTNGTATIGTDYTPVSQTVVFSPGVSNVVVPIPINNNNIVEGNRTVPLLLTNAVGTTLVNPTNATLTIIDTVNAPGQLSFSATNYTVTEGGGVGFTNAYITVVRSYGSSGSVSVQFKTADGTALSGSKYITTNGVLSFGAGETTKSFPVQVLNTPTAEGPELFSVILTNATGGASLTSPTNATVTILNTNTGIAFALATNYVTEPYGTAAGSVVLNVMRYNNTNGTSTVQFTTTDGTAVAGTNYVAYSSQLTFAPGQSLIAVPITLLYDPLVTGDLTFTASLSSPSTDAQLTTPILATVVIHDVNAGISFVKSAQNAYKTSGGAVINVFNSNPSANPVTVNYATGGGSAVPGVDYTAASGTLTFTGGQTNATFIVPIIANNLVHTNRSFGIALSAPSARGVLLAPTTETVTIIGTNTPYGLSFSSPLVISGDWGKTNSDNTTGSPEIGDPLIAGTTANHVVWFQWTPTNSGSVTFDTIGSVDDTNFVYTLDTVMAVFTGTSLSSLNQIAANDDIFPNYQYNAIGQQYYNLNYQYYNYSFSGGVFSITNYSLPLATPIRDQAYYQPYSGPSKVTFNAVRGTTYFIGVDTKVSSSTNLVTGRIVSSGLGGVVTTPSTGLISLNWALHPSGVFRFASENADLTGLTYSNNQSMLLHEVSQNETTRQGGGLDPARYDTTLKINYQFDVLGAIVKVTRVAGSSGRVQVNYTTMSITNDAYLVSTNPLPGNIAGIGNNPFLVNPTYLANGDQVAVAGSDYTPVSGTLTFDDSEMSKTIFIPIINNSTTTGGGGGNLNSGVNRDFLVVLTNATLDVAESSDVQPPRLDNTYNQMVVRILDTDIDPMGPSFTSGSVTNVVVVGGTLVTNVSTNTVFNLTPTNSVFNFMKSHFRVTRDVGSYYNGTPVTVYVNRSGTNQAASPTVYWNVNSYYLDHVDSLRNNEFPLQPGSDYATPDPANSGGVAGLVPDFIFPGGYSGSLTWGAKDFYSKPISFNVYDNGMQQFNEDFVITLYEIDSNGNEFPCGMVNQCTVTILAADNHPPAGSVDENYNADFSYNMVQPFPTVPPQMSHPGTDGEVYGLAVQPDNKTVLVGDFFSYDLSTRNCIARANTDGTLDTTFNPGSGANDSITCITLSTNNELVIGGNFTAYNGSFRSRIALVNANGILDTSFNPGQGFNGTVNAILQQPNGQLLVGGDFTAYNGRTKNYLARLNMDGSLDTSFDAGTNLNAAVYAIGLQSNGQIVVGGDFTLVNGVVGQNYIARLSTNGTFDASFDPGSGANAPIFTLAIQPDDSIVAGGEFTQVNGQPKNSIVRLTPNGYIDPTFYCGTGVDGPIYSIVLNTNVIYSTSNNLYSVLSTNIIVQTNFTFYVGGAFTAYNGTHRLGFARINNDGTLDTTFLDTAYNEFAGLPRERYADPLGTVVACGLQSDGNVMIGGTFERVGGGQSDDYDVRPDNLDTNGFVVYQQYGGTITPNARGREGIRNRSNIARLVGGATPGPGNVGLLYPNYTINKSQSPMYVSLVRNNGFLGNAGVNFSVTPGLALPGQDYSYQNNAPYYGVDWEYRQPSRMHSDGLFGTNGFPEDAFGSYWSGASSDLGTLLVNILDNTNSLSNLNATYTVANPASDQFYLGGEDIALGVGLGVAASPLTLIDDHHASGTFSFANSSYTANGQTAPVAVTRTNGTYGLVSLTYATTTNGSTASANSDYVPAIGTITFQPADTSRSFAIQVLNTNYTTPVEKYVNLILYNINPPVNGLASLGLTNATLRIINPNFQGFLGFNTNVYPAAISAGSVNVTVARTVGSLGTLTVQYATTNGTATNGIDYIGSTNTLSWTSGDVSPRTISIPLLNNHVIGTSKQFGLALSNPTLNGSPASALFATNAITNAVVVINNDNNYGSFQFNAATYIVNERGGNTLVTVLRNGSTNGAVTVQYATANNTAVAGINYTPTNGTLSFAPGQTAASFAVQVRDDGVVDPPPASFYFSLNLSNPSTGATLGSQTNSIVEIVDAESYNRPPGSGDTTFNPGSGMDGDIYALALQSSGQIVAGGNFIGVNGVPENYLARLNVDGSLDRAGFLFGLAGADGPVYALADQTDDKILAGGTFGSINGVVLNRIVRLQTDGNIDSGFNPGAGADNTIYSLAETFVNGPRKIYAAGAFSTMNGYPSPYLVRLNDNGTIDTTFNTGTGPNSTIYSVAVYPTNSPFAGQLLIGGQFTNVNSVLSPFLARLNVNGSLDTNFSAKVNIGGTVRALAIQGDGEILIGGDFTNVNSKAINRIARLNPDGSLDTNFTAGVTSGINGTVNAIAIQADNRIMVAGQFTVANGVTRNNITRLMPNGAVDPSINFGDGANGAVKALVIQPGDQMSVIAGSFTQYNDQPAGHIARIYGGSETGSGAFDFNLTSYTVHENGIQALIGVRRTGGTSGTNADGSGSVSVHFATADSNAVAGVNYIAVSTNVVFPPGEVLKQIPVMVIDDSNITPNLIVSLNLSNPSAQTALGNQQPATLTIINDDSAVKFGLANYSVAKNILTGLANIDVARIGGSSGYASVNFQTTTNGTAIDGTDFVSTNLTVYFNPGDTDVVVQVPIINNTIPEGNRTVVFALTNATGSLLYAPTNAVLTIVDTVQAPGQLFLASSNYVTSSGAGTAYLTVLRTNGSSGAVSVNYATVAGTAQPGVDYGTVNGTVTFNDGDTSENIAIPIINNSSVQGSVNLSVFLSNPSGGASLLQPTNALLTIINTNVGVGFVSATNSAVESAGFIQVNVQRVGNTNGVVTVNYATTNGTAIAGTNYLATSGLLTFFAGESAKAISVPLINNTNSVGNLFFTIGLSNPSSGAKLLPQSTTTVIVQDAFAELSFTNATMTVLKNAGPAVIPVVCSNTNLEPAVATNTIPLQVSYTTVDGSAVAGVDYTATSGILYFTNGIATNNISVPIINNGLVTSNRTFNVVLSSPTAPGKLAAPSTNSVTIINTVSGLSFASSAFTVQKTGVAATITVSRSSYTNSTVTVNFLATNGTALAGINFGSTNGTLTFTNGVTSQTFQVPIIDTTAVQPDLTVQLQLSSPSGGSALVAPSAATLTIHDNTGSYVVPAGSYLIWGNGTNFGSGIIDTNCTNTVLFALRDAGGTNVSNLSAILLATNGITPMLTTTGAGVATETNNYGALYYAGHSVSRPYTFSVHGTNSQQVAATFRLLDGNNVIGTAVFGYTLGVTTTTFSNATTIVINDNTNASPYPSIINVNGVGTSLVKATVTLNKLWHTSPGDIDALVVAPAGTNTLIMAHTGGGYSVTNVTLTFDDGVTNTLPHTTQITTSTNKPTQFYPVRNFP